MSRLAKLPIKLPKGVEVKGDKGGAVTVKGPKGTLALNLPAGLSLKFEGDSVELIRDEKIMEMNSFHGLFWSLLRNQITGVSDGFEIRLNMVGVGYRAAVQGTKLDLSVGYSHPTALEIPKTLQVAVEKGTVIIVKGCDKREVGQFAAQVRGTRPPEPYKGKGIRYENEYVRKKEGKAAKGKSA